MQNFEILLNERFTATTQSLSSELQLLNDYYVYVVQNGGGMVNAFNVRNYLNDSRNQQITTDFFAYLTGSTSHSEALNILTSDKKLSDVFNDYYQTIVLSAITTGTTAVIQQNLTGTTNTITQTFNHPWSGFAPSKQLTGITQDIYGSINDVQSFPFLSDFTTEESYYIPVYLERGTNQLDRHMYDICDVFINQQTIGLFPQFSAITSSIFSISSGSTSSTATTADTRLHTILDCFVDINLETNENVNVPSASNPLFAINSVSFEFSAYTISEGSSLQVKISLANPSASGVEQATINMISPSTNTLLPGQDFVSLESYPTVVAWNTGDQDKFLSFTANTDFFIENTESIILQISNIINLDPGPILSTQIFVTDTTILRTVSLSVLPPGPIIPGPVQGVNMSVISEGDSIDLTLTLNAPAFGVENITLQLVPSASVIGGTVGPAINSAAFGSDFTISATSMTFSFLPGETQKTFRLSALTDSIVESTETIYFEILNPQFCLIDQNNQVVQVDIKDINGVFKYVHLNLGTIYSNLGDVAAYSELRRMTPAPGNFYISSYPQTLFRYGDSLPDTSTSSSVSYYINDVNVKVTNMGSSQSFVNNIPLLPGQHTTIIVPGNNFIITASTNDLKNTITNYLDYANYKLEIQNLYSGSPIMTGIDFNLRALDNMSQQTNKTLDLGTYLLSGMTTVLSSTTNQYRLESKYKNIMTGRINTGSFSSPIWACQLGIESVYESSHFENASVLGIIFLNFMSGYTYSSWPTTEYDAFDFISGVTNTATYYTCGQIGTSTTINPMYTSVPFKLQP